MQRDKQAKRGGSGSEWQKTRRRIFARDNGQCQLADETCDPILDISDAHIDHIKALADGGETHDFNLRVLCVHHHRLKTRYETAARIERMKEHARKGIR